MARAHRVVVPACDDPHVIVTPPGGVHVTLDGPLGDPLGHGGLLLSWRADNGPQAAAQLRHLADLIDHAWDADNTRRYQIGARL